jgi:hypothetical protein
MKNHSFWVEYVENGGRELVTVTATSAQRAHELIKAQFEEHDVIITERGSK